MCDPLQYQYLWGPGVMVAPVTGQNTTKGNVYLPDDIFYDFYSHKTVRGHGESITKDVPYTTIPLYYKGGSIVAQRAASANTTTELRKNNFEIIIAPGLDGTASGSLYLDDGVSLEQPATSYIQFHYSKKGKFRMTGSFGYNAGVSIEAVIVLGESSSSTSSGENASADASSKVKLQKNIPLTGPYSMDL